MGRLASTLVLWPAVLWWQLRRFMQRGRRRIGLDGLAIVLGLMLVLGLMATLEQSTSRYARHAAQASAAALLPKVPEPTVPERSNLSKFEDALLPHDDIPDALNGIFELASTEKLVLAKGEYRMQVDEAGRFVRYRMALPVRGNARALQRFIEQALVDNPSLAFESVQFKRERIQSDQVEAQIQWTLITAMPPGAVAASAKAGP